MKKLLLPLFLIVTILACKKEKNKEDCSLQETTPIEGFSLLEKLQGIWNGPLSSPTPLGSFPEWIVDFRAISPSQIAAKNELDAENDIFMSFFVAELGECEYKLAFRNGGGFAGQQRISYMYLDSVYESTATSFYRFSDPIKGKDRVFTTLQFSGNSLTMETYTNKYNSLNEAVLHFSWQATRQDLSASEEAKEHFDFPKKEQSIPFTHSFDNMQEAVFYTTGADPFPEEAQPYLGTSNISITITNPSTVDSSKKVLILISTEPLFNGFLFNPINLKYRSRYVIIPAAQSTSFSFNYMHPGNYYLNAIYDLNGDFNFSSGDYMNGAFDRNFSLAPESSVNASVQINFEIP
ncbi:MAG: hypothetical protein R2772_04250 [Chitinophagales bacterium]